MQQTGLNKGGDFEMSMIRIENLTYYYPSSFDPVFENANFQIDTEWNLGFVGRNVPRYILKV